MRNLDPISVRECSSWMGQPPVALGYVRISDLGNDLLAAKCRWFFFALQRFLARDNLFDVFRTLQLESTNWEVTAMDRVSGQKDIRIQKAVQVLNNDPFRTLPELADNCKISSSRLSHLFKSDIGVNVKHYRLDCRLQMAAEMLLWTHRPVKEIAYAVGYRHCSSFVRAFSTHFGFSPTCCRNNQLRRAA